MADDITELEELGAEKVSGVGAPANGTEWLVLKAAEGHNGVVASPESPHTKSPEADEQEEEMTKAEADEIEALLTKQNACGAPGCEHCESFFASLPEDTAHKARLKAKQRRGLPKSVFAIPEKAPGSVSYPMPDKAHAESALSLMHNASPEEQKRIKAKAQRDFGVGGQAKKSPGVPDASVATPREHGHLATGQSGLTGPMTAGVHNKPPAETLGGQSPYVIPEEAKINTNGGLPATKETWEIEVVEKQSWVTLGADGEPPVEGGGEEVGSPEWEEFDADTLDHAANGLAGIMRSITEIRNREVAEALSGDRKDWFDAFQLDCAHDDVCQALGLVATLAYRERAEAGTATKAGRSALRSVRDHLDKILAEGNPAETAGNGARPSEEESIMATVTKEELDAHIAATVDAAVAKASKKEAKKAAKRMKKMPKKIADAMEKNANNGGDITEGTMRGEVHGQHDANDVNSVPDGGHVDGQYVNKGGGKKGARKQAKLAKALEENTALLRKIAQRPQRGGPVLDGQPRGAGTSPASESRISGSVAKGTDDGEIETLTKSLADLQARSRMGGPEAELAKQEADRVGTELTLRRLRQGHEAGVI